MLGNSGRRGSGFRSVMDRNTEELFEFDESGDRNRYECKGINEAIQQRTLSKPGLPEATAYKLRCILHQKQQDPDLEHPVLTEKGAVAETPLRNYSAIRFVFLSLVGLLVVQGSAYAGVDAQDALVDGDPFGLPEFSPTRRPQQQQQKQQSEAAPAAPVAGRPLGELSTGGKLQREPQEAVESREKRLRSGKQQFVSTNELETFLDDMNHNELRAVAAGKPIDLFQPKPLTGAQMSGAPGKSNKMNIVLEGSHSEQQIYTECALILQRTYVKNINDPMHQMVPFGKTEQSCINYKHIDKALAKAKQMLKFKARQKQLMLTSLEPPEELVAALGELSQATTQILADQFELSNDELLNGLPLIDMSKTKFWPLCPMLVRQDLKCKLTRFRMFTGHCNNLKHPTWGAAMTPFARYLPPVHPDGISEPRKSVVSEFTYELGPGHKELHARVSPTLAAPIYLASRDPSRSASSQVAYHTKPDKSVSGPPEYPTTSESLVRRKRRLAPPSKVNELPSARLITSIVHKNQDLPHHDFSILFMSWGQMLDHDMTRAAPSSSDTRCCGAQSVQDSLCLPIEVPEDDPLYSKFNIKCLEFKRSVAGLRPNCVLGPRVHQNAITSPIDANFVYGSSRSTADSLRLFKGGKLRSRDWFRNERLKPLLPAQEVEPDKDCLGRPDDLFCFRAGDVRANEQTHLTVLHTLYMREHNRIAGKLEELNPHWNDERIYQETRHIVAAGVQHVMLNEYLPLLIGRKLSELYNLTAHETSASWPNSGKPSGAHWHGYDPSVTTSVANSFAAAAFRQGHTFVQGTVERYNKHHELLGSERLRNLFKRPFLIYEPGVLDQLTGGMLNQASQGYDPFISEEISGHLFQPPESAVGHDLPAINLQRGREQGLPGYNLFREWCGLPRAENFAQLEPYLSNATAYQYSRLYKHVDDIDLWSGGVSERRLPGAAIGPTFACIIARQFSNTRRGDRFWYENPDLPSSFSSHQLAELRKISLAKILCANSDDLPTIQRWSLRLVHPILNPRLPCRQLPEPDLRHWQEEN